MVVVELSLPTLKEIIRNLKKHSSYENYQLRNIKYVNRKTLRCIFNICVKITALFTTLSELTFHYCVPSAVTRFIVKMN